MASGKLGSAAPAATTNTVIYTVPVDKYAVVSISVLNRSATACNEVRIAVGANTNPSTMDFLEYNVSLPPTGVVERSGVVMSTGEKVVVYAQNATASVRVHGIEGDV